jgi:rhodanese-related sulfurtransferase
VTRFAQGTSLSITPLSLYQTLGLLESPALVDLRFCASNLPSHYVPTSRCDLGDVPFDTVTRLLNQKKVIVICQDGGKRSQSFTEQLLVEGIRAQFLEGGFDAWQRAGLATVTTRVEFNAPNRSRWITRERPKIDRLACPWLVRRFIDPGAQFFYTSAQQMRGDAETLQAEPYDIADVTFSHRGERCSFDAFLHEFAIHDPILDEVATIVRAADTGDLDAAAQAPGLLAISLGLSVNIKDDIVLLEQAMPLYDALYAWCKNARGETHSWPQKKV